LTHDKNSSFPLCKRIKTEGNEGNEEFMQIEAPVVDPGPNAQEFAVPEEFCPAPI
jgi:hypothetical protein